MNTKEQLTNQIRSGKAGIYVLTWEENRFEGELKAIANERGFGLYIWSLTQGILQIDGDKVAKIGPEDPMEMLDAFGKLPEKCILTCRDFHLFLKESNPIVVRKIKDALALGKGSNRVLLIEGCKLHLPPELEKEFVVIEFKLPGREELLPIAEAISKSSGAALNGNAEPLLDAGSGLTSSEFEDALALAFIETNKLCPMVVAREKANTIKKNGILEIMDTNISLDDIGGMDIRKEWLLRRKRCFSKEAKAYGLPMPKGELKIGVPGCGKTLGAKATAKLFGVPLLRLDAGKLFAGHVGESEANVRAMIATCEAVAPCVLFIDELEKGLGGSKSSNHTDGGTTARVFGTFLQWMQDKIAPVYVYATANDISALPPEFLRKGRWDELWFVDLPNEEERRDIWKIQIAKHGRKPNDFDVMAVAKATEGFTGAEIESVFSEALFAGFAENREPGDLDLDVAITQTVPLSKTMATEIENLRKWADGRARRVSSTKQSANERKFV